MLTIIMHICLVLICQTSCTIKKHSEQCLKSSLTSDANKSANSNLTLSKSADASRIWIEGLQKTSHQEVHSGGTVEVHNESSVDNQHEIHASVISESIMSKERVGSSCDSVATKPTLGLKEDFPSCLQERHMNMTYNSNTDKVAKLSTANHKKANLAKVYVLFNSKMTRKNFFWLSAWKILFFLPLLIVLL